MAKKPGKLRDALNRYQGKDLEKEHKKKVYKQNEKKSSAKRAQRQAKDDNEEIENETIEGAADDMTLEGGVAIDGQEDDDWEDDDTDDEARAGFDMSRLEDSDSDSSGVDEAAGDASTRQIKATLAALKANGIPATATAKKTKTTATSKPLKTSSKPTAAAAVASEVPQAVQEGAEEAEDSEGDASDIPLSEIGSDTEDIVPHRRLTINNTAALTRALSSFALPLSTLPFSTHQSLTTSAPVSIPDIEDDLNRELAFYAQSLSAVQEARKLLKAEGVPFTRPTDYFAEMVKSDEHMGKVKGKLVDAAAGKKAAAEARRQRDLKKFGKQVQQEKLKERAQEKKQMLDRVNVLKRKRQGAGLESGGGGDDMFDVELEDAMDGRDTKKRRGAEIAGRGGARAGGRGGHDDSGPNRKRAGKNEKYGFGGKKRFAKSGDAQSAGDVSGFSVKRMKGQTKGGGAKRPGKARRASAKMR